MAEQKVFDLRFCDPQDYLLYRSTQIKEGLKNKCVWHVVRDEHETATSSAPLSALSSVAAD